MATLEHCLGLYSLDKEDAAELGAFVSSEGDPVKGLQKYLATLDREMADLESAVREAGPDLESQAEGFSEDEAGRQDLGRLVAEGADREVLDNHPVVLKALEDMAARPETYLDKIYNSDEWHAGREYIFGSDTVQGTAAALDRWVEGAEAFAGGEVKREKRLTLVLGPPAAGKSTIAEDLAKTKGAAILDSDEIKKTLPEFDGGIGSAAVHEESSDLAHMLEAALRADGTNIVYPKVGGSPGSIRKTIERFKKDGYEVELVNMAVTAENAYKRMIGRFVDKGRLIPPSYVDAVGENPTGTFKTLKEEGQADGYAQIDNNAGKDDPKPVSEIEGRNPLEGSSYDLQRGGGKGIQPVTRAGENIEGAQENLADQVPVGVRKDADGVDMADTINAQDLAADLDADDEFVEQLGLCLKG